MELNKCIFPYLFIQSNFALGFLFLTTKSEPAVPFQVWLQMLLPDIATQQDLFFTITTVPCVHPPLGTSSGHKNF